MSLNSHKTGEEEDEGGRVLQSSPPAEEQHEALQL